MARVNESAVVSALTEHREVMDALDAQLPDVIALAETIAASIAGGGQLLVCGNGGSAADSQHIAAELVGRFALERDPMPAIALTTNTSSLTAIGNDYGFDEVFARQVRAYGRPGDVFLAISTSGASKNLLRAADEARLRGLSVLGLSGGDGGALSRVCDRSVIVHSTSTPRVQEAHAFIAHVLCGLVEEAVCSGRS